MLVDSDQWFRVASAKLTAIKKPDKTLFYRPIRHSFESTSFILVGCGNDRAKPTWFYGGFCRLLLPSTVASSLQKNLIVTTEKLYLGQLQLIQCPNLEVSQMSIEIVPAKWHESFYYEIWRYTGEAVGINADIKAIRTALNASLTQQ